MLNLEELTRELEDLQHKAEAGIALVPDARFLASFVQLERCSMGWKQQTLASFAGVSLSTVQRIERGDTVSADSLEKVAVALGQQPGAFTEPRVPLATEQFHKKLQEWLAPWHDVIPVQVRPLTKQTQVIRLTRAEICYIEASQLDDRFQDEVQVLRESFNCASLIIGSQQPNSPIKMPNEKKCRRRELYSSILDQVKKIQRVAEATALSGTYNAETNHPDMRSVVVGLIAFFPKRSDPGAIRRRVLFGPKLFDMRKAIEVFLNEPVHVYRMGGR